jgi:hypothetical protein
MESAPFVGCKIDISGHITNVGNSGFIDSRVGGLGCCHLLMLSKAGRSVSGTAKREGALDIALRLSHPLRGKSAGRLAGAS